jgi:hypothetical protein
MEQKKLSKEWVKNLLVPNPSNFSKKLFNFDALWAD